MASDVKDLAANLFYYARGNAIRIASIKSAFDVACGGILTKGGMDMLTSATKNSVSMNKISALSEKDRQTTLRLAMDYLAAGFLPSQSRSRGRFF